MKITIQILLILLFLVQATSFAKTTDTFIVKDLSDSLTVKFVCSKNSLGKYEGIVSIFLNGNDIPIITDEFIDSDESLSKFCPDDIISEKPVEPDSIISFRDQRIVYLRDKNLDEKEDIVIINRRDMRRYVSTIYINTGNIYKYDKLITEAFNWYEIEVNPVKKVIYGSGTPSLTSSRSGTYFIEDGRIKSHEKYISDVMSNNFINNIERKYYENGELIETIKRKRISLSDDAREVFSFNIDEDSMKVYFISSNERIHFAIEDLGKNEILYYFPSSYPYQSNIKTVTSENELLFYINNEEFVLKFTFHDESIDALTLLANSSDSKNKLLNAKLESMKGNYMDILKFKNIIKE